MLELLVGLIFLCIVGGILWYIITLLPLPPPFPVIIQLLLLLVLLVIAWQILGPLALGGFHSAPLLR